MNLLLDTHVVLWALSAPERLGPHREQLEDPDTTRLLSAVVVWEVAIKSGLGRLDVPRPLTTWLRRVRDELVVEDVAVSAEHAVLVADLPDHHRDPFDRLLVAQAIDLGVPLVTADRQLGSYDVDVVDLGPQVSGSE